MKNKNKVSHDSPPLGISILLVQQDLRDRMIKQYSTSQGFFYTKTIDDLIQKKQGDQNCIATNDVKFDDGEEHMEKFYPKSESGHEFPELLEYYKYYSQDSICFLNRDYAFLASHHEKKKAVLYKQLKKQLDISDSAQTIEQSSRVKENLRFDNVLSGLEFTIQENDESYMVAEVLKNLVKHYGPSRLKTLNKIDSQFKFMTHNLTMSKPKVNMKEGPILNPKTMLQSTNTSVRNFGKQKKESNKNITHRRFGSCQIPKGPNSKIGNTPKDKKSRIKRRKSSQLLSLIEINTQGSTLSPQIYRKSAVKTQEYNMSVKPVMDQANFRDKMQELRRKIRKQKQNLTHKTSQSTCSNKRKTKK